MDSTIRYRIPVTIPDGSYEGKWGGHRLIWEFEGNEVDVETKLGIRGINIPVRFKIVNGKVDETTIKTLGNSSI